MRDFDAIKKKEMSSIENRIRHIYNVGYEDCLKDQQKVKDEAYKQGLHDAWQCCKRFSESDSGKCNTIWGYSAWDDFLEQSPSDAIEMVKEYDEKTFDVPDNCKIEVGDVCRYQTCERIFIITSIHEGIGGEEYFDAIYSNGEAIKNGKLSVIEKINGECVDKLENIFSDLINICISGKADA